MPKKQEYLVKKYNAEGCNYDNCFYSTYAAAWANTSIRDIMYVCKKDGIYYYGFGWRIEPADIIRIVRRRRKTK